MTEEHLHLEAVRRLVADIPSGACWALTGSMNHVLQGVPLERVGDIDVITDDAGLRPATR